ncbi:hypothetical protein F0562_003166 [Nyssa sinensis]|uniref:Uncharacterized protein n=1 Tax=Nyssa sinensis TaxID=561372 RepID=A0A5J5BYD7_9ASTE|nr:hypothetical protein F0562_003136 [Nyssa sinensis]KAA8546737.1 hypothetical protein F0562_003166 [Nyssa sinensis]
MRKHPSLEEITWDCDENGIISSQGLVVEGGGEKKGIVGMIEGIVVGMVGSGVAGNGGRVTFGSVGIVGNVGFGRDGIWVLGKGGNVGFGKVGAIGKEVLGNGGNVAVGKVGIAGRGGIVGSVGATGGEACNRLRAARLTWMLETENAMMKDRTKQWLKAAIVGQEQEGLKSLLF